MTEGIEFVDGGVCAPQGIRAAGVHAGFRDDPDRLDLALVVADGEAPTAAGLFTKNVFCAAPVQVSRKHVANGHARAVVLNSGNANAATGMPGLEAAHKTASLVAGQLGCIAEDVLVASTGVIGVPLPFTPFETGVPALAQGLSAEGGADAARAIMTTDTHPKECAVRFEACGTVYHVGGMAKGSGMIQPDMATMLAVLTTDYPLAPDKARSTLEKAVGVSFNRVTVDSDTSTNDSAILLSSGAAGGASLDNEAFSLEERIEAYAAFASALIAVCNNLARQIAADGEGATKLVTVNVRGAASDEDADKAARTVANSPLVKTAIAGRDCNWGRVAAALGRSGAYFEQEDVDIDIMHIPVLRRGLPCLFSEDEATARFEEPEVVIDIDLNAGNSTGYVWTCDLTHDYISINADYRT